MTGNSDCTERIGQNNENIILCEQQTFIGMAETGKSWNGVQQIKNVTKEKCKGKYNYQYLLPNLEN